VTEPIRYNGQNVLQPSFQTGSSSSSHSYCNIFFLVAFLEEVFICNIIIILCVNYIIIISSNVNAIINNNYERLQDLILFFRISIGTRKDLFEIYRQLGHASSKGSPALGCAISDESFRAWLINCVTASAPGKPDVKRDQEPDTLNLFL